ncbi:MAG: microcin ABC transporter ATP-binding protein [Caedibacter sp. 37-49]|nr:MAG: microcin ABC transporter ATP-binding protein [Caedibacter sp. 37-49]
MTHSLLSLKNLWICFGDNAAVKGLNFDLKHGQTMALVGESGSGKSVTALSVLKLLPYPRASHPHGEIWFNDENLLAVSEERLRKIRGAEISMIFQEPMTSLNPLHTIEKQIGEVLVLHKNFKGLKLRERIIELLELVGFSDATERLTSYPHQLSGGQRQRVMIAMALATEPSLLIADEPTTALDVTTQAQILELLNTLQKKFNMGLLLITHDLSIVQKMAEKIVIMQRGECVEAGHTKNIFKNPQHPYTQQLLNSEPKASIKKLAQNVPTILEAKNLSVKFMRKSGLFTPKTYFHAVKDVSLYVKQGETLGIVGESGSGKTTLALALLRLQESQGEILLQGKPIHHLKSKELRFLRHKFQIVFQDPFSSLSPRMTISEIIGEGLKIHHSELTNKQQETLIIEALKEVKLDPETRHRYPHEFSGGQRQRVAIARALILKPQILVLDEPTSALDRAIQVEVLELLKDLQDKHNLTYIFISHDLKIIRAISQHVIVMRQGLIVEYGPTATLYENPQHPYTQALFKAAFELKGE